ncbi:MAG: hypothetical protein RLZZ628_3174, partial [Bacteroidota bacterium]
MGLIFLDLSDLQYFNGMFHSMRKVGYKWGYEWMYGFHGFHQFVRIFFIFLFGFRARIPKNP